MGLDASGLGAVEIVYEIAIAVVKDGDSRKSKEKRSEIVVRCVRRSGRSESDEVDDTATTYSSRYWH